MSVQLLWAKQQSTFNTSESDSYSSIAVDTSGNSYIAYFTNGTVSGGTNAGDYSWDIVVFKMNSSGVLQWTKQQTAFNTTSYDYSPSIGVDTSGNCYVAYWTAGGTVSGGTNTGGYDIVVFKMNSSGDLQWTKQQSTFNTTNYDTYPSIAVDASGNSYISYHTQGTVSDGTNSGGSDIVVFKMNSSGDLQWVKQESAFNTTGDDTDTSITVDASGNCYVAYYTNGTVSGGTNTGGASDIVVFKMNSSGVLQWTKQESAFNTTGEDSFPSIGVDASGNCYVAYQVYGSTVSGGTNAGGYDIVVFKMNSSGDLQWTKQQSTFNTANHDTYPSIAVDASGNSYISYHSNGTVTDGTNSGGTDIIVFKMNSSGDLQWTKQQAVFNTTGYDVHPRIALDTLNNSYITYYTPDTISGGTNSGGQDIVVFKLGAGVAISDEEQQLINLGISQTDIDLVKLVSIPSNGTLINNNFSSITNTVVKRKAILNQILSVNGSINTFQVTASNFGFTSRYVASTSAITIYRPSVSSVSYSSGVIYVPLTVNGSQQTFTINSNTIILTKTGDTTYTYQYNSDAVVNYSAGAVISIDASVSLILGGGLISNDPLQPIQGPICYIGDTKVLSKDIATGIEAQVCVKDITPEKYLVFSTTQQKYVPVRVNCISGEIDKFILIKKGLLGENKPSENFYVTPSHPILYKNFEVEAKNIIGAKKVNLEKQYIYTLVTDNREALAINNIDVICWEHKAFITKYKKTKNAVWSENENISFISKS